jgi:2-hydroxychromene-2-carboxylate isomerase
LAQPVFLYDLASPWCWVVAERINSELDGGPPAWTPVSLRALSSSALDAVADVDVDALTVLAPMPPRLPSPLPFDSGTAMLAATFAKKGGRAVAFSLAAFRQAYAAGRDLSVTDNVLIAAAACELHPRALLKGIETRSVSEALVEATESARELGVTDLPALVVDGSVVERVELIDRMTAGDFG